MSYQRLFVAMLMGTTILGCQGNNSVQTQNGAEVEVSKAAAEKHPAEANPEIWPSLEPLPLDPEIEQRIDVLLSKMTLEQKVGQVIQADSESVTPEEVKKYRLGSVLSGGNSAPGEKPYADASLWLEDADKYFQASLDLDGVEVAIPVIWGIDAVHGHANLTGAIVFPHNIGLGAANNPDLIEKISQITAHELVVSGHDWTFAPTLAVPRDVRWGRSYEGFSSKSDIQSSYSARIVEGLQGKFGDEDFMKDGRVISSAKHFLGDGATEKGRDQGDAIISEEELRDIDGAGYIGAVESGVQTIMASFSGWHGKKMHGNKSLLTGVLKEQMNFQGFIVGDWNGHGQVEGCTNTDCPQALNAGLDMYMAPDSWKGLYESTLEHVKSGVVSQERLDDAVRRILRVKIASGIFEKPLPSQRKYAGDNNELGKAEHREVARQAVRESLVLLKNNDSVLPIDAGKTVLVVGDGADSISKAAGGWTLSWQGGDAENSDFPNGNSILDGIKEAVEAAGGKVIFSPEGDTDIAADVVIAVYGEDPYAEFQGDIDHLDFKPKGFDVSKLSAYKEAGADVVSVFLSGRPLWTNPEINASDAFVAAWLPGSEGAGVSDVLFQVQPEYDFTGRLSFPWPATADADKALAGDYLFDLGYGLNYSSDAQLDVLSLESGVSDHGVDKGNFYSKGLINPDWKWRVNGSSGIDMNAVEFGKVDHKAQEDAVSISWKKPDIMVSIISDKGEDFSRESNGALELSFTLKSLSGDVDGVKMAMGCMGSSECTSLAKDLGTVSSEWTEYRFSLSCFAEDGVDMTKLQSAINLVAPEGAQLGVSNVMLAQDEDGVANCSVK
ncbi:glycoside hydrolase family 3 protein [Hirschia maritima]|uniref:glycoside hydrolase family 3 protein n=1 Tax=Hirschia maritima TaxID=1121961 RepID=UPI000382137D|nr:glycoside hydrolase family 3 protein [Hirschia maritima]